MTDPDGANCRPNRREQLSWVPLGDGGRPPQGIPGDREKQRSLPLEVLDSAGRILGTPASGSQWSQPRSQGAPLLPRGGVPSGQLSGVHIQNKLNYCPPL